MIDDMRALCARENLEEAALHIEDGKSGGRRDRDEFQAWLNDARTGACDVLVNPVTDRLTREGLNVAAMILDVVEGKDPATGKLTHMPVRLVDCNGLDSLHGDAFRFRFVIQAEVGRAERERIRQRSRDRARRLRHAGRWGGGTPPFGYKAVPNPELNEDREPKGWVLAVEPAEAKHIRDAAESLLQTEPDPLNKVVRRLNHAGVKPRRAKEWSRQTLAKVLTGDHIMRPWPTWPHTRTRPPSRASGVSRPAVTNWPPLSLTGGQRWFRPARPWRSTGRTPWWMTAGNYSHRHSKS
ncbi:recombinase family protein [Streptomyces sparsogenes]|uniref:recombinase family protein n=1 Tax=Streptomyces sparsogenes TaxID=67365 RepID=UPI0033EA1C39